MFMGMEVVSWLVNVCGKVESRVNNTRLIHDTYRYFNLPRPRE